MKILGIDTSGKSAGAAILSDERLVGESYVYTEKTHSQVILPIVKKLLSDTDTNLSDIEIIAVSAGPGSYTGLRIGIGAVKGMCIGLDKPALGVSTLEALAYNISGFDGIIFSVMKARQNVVYAGGYKYDESQKLLNCFQDKVTDSDTAADFIKNSSGRVMLVGDFAAEFKEQYFSENENVMVAPMNLRLQRASGICQAALKNSDKAQDCSKLEAMYLQQTKAQKDKAHSK